MVFRSDLHLCEEYAILMPKKNHYLALEYCSEPDCYGKAEYGEIKKRLAVACCMHANKNQIKLRNTITIDEYYMQHKEYIIRHFAPVTYNRLDKIFKQKESRFNKQSQKIANTYLNLMDINVIYPCILSFLI